MRATIASDRHLRGDRPLHAMPGHQKHKRAPILRDRPSLRAQTRCTCPHPAWTLTFLHRQRPNAQRTPTHHKDWRQRVQRDEAGLAKCGSGMRA